MEALTPNQTNPSRVPHLASFEVSMLGVVIDTSRPFWDTLNQSQRDTFNTAAVAAARLFKEGATPENAHAALDALNTTVSCLAESSRTSPLTRRAYATLCQYTGIFSKAVNA